MTSSISLDKSTLPAFTDDLQVEVDQIREDYLSGALAQEFSLLRACRLIIEDKYRGIEVENRLSGEKVVFVHQEGFLRHVSALCNVSRQTLFNRLEGYRNLTRGLGMTYEQAFYSAVNAPGTPQRIERTGVVTFGEGGEIQEVDFDKARSLCPNIGDIENGDKTLAVTDALRELVTEAAALENRAEAARMVDGKLAKPSIRFFHRNGDGILISEYIERGIDPDGVIYEKSPIITEWSPNATPPVLVVEKMISRLGASERMSK